MVSASNQSLLETLSAEIAPHFDVDFYCRFSGSTHENAKEHFLTRGWRENLNPSPEFFMAGYRFFYRETRDLNINPLVYHVRAGERKNHQPIPVPEHSYSLEEMMSLYDIIRPEFDNEFYISQTSKDPLASCDPVKHYIVIGHNKGLDPAQYFSTQHYIDNNPDIVAARKNAFGHFLQQGRLEGRSTQDHRYNDGFHIPAKLADRSVTHALPITMGRSDSEPDQNLKTAVHLHAYYLDDLESVLRKISSTCGSVSIFITTNDESKAVVIKRTLTAMQWSGESQVVIVPNRGRDIAPLLIDIAPRLLDYDLALHLHLKKSIEKEKVGREWFEQLLVSVIADQTYVNLIKEKFKRNSKLGLVIPEPFYKIRPFCNWGQNLELGEQLNQRLKLGLTNLDALTLNFPAGSFFWFRPASLKALFSNKFEYSDFPEEPVEDDGTIAHAIERMIGYVAEAAGYSVLRVKPSPPEANAVSYNSQTDISVIIPVYNAENWLAHAVQSLIQSESYGISVEILLIDNNSSDNSLKLAREFEATYHNIRVLTEERQGAGFARNKGLDEAKGHYITFLDADDMLTGEALSVQYNVARTRDCDIVVNPLVMFTENTKTTALPAGYVNSPGLIEMKRLMLAGTNYKPREGEEARLSSMLTDFGPCAKLFRRSFIEQNELRFPSSGNYEDNLFIYSAYMSANHIWIDPTIIYLYRKFSTDKGATQSTSLRPQDVSDQINAIDSIIELTQKLSNIHVKRMIEKALLLKLEWLSGDTQNPVDLWKPHLERVLPLVRKLNIARHLSDLSLLDKSLRQAVKSQGQTDD